MVLLIPLLWVRRYKVTTSVPITLTVHDTLRATLEERFASRAEHSPLVKLSSSVALLGRLCAVDRLNVSTSWAAVKGGLPE